MPKNYWPGVFLVIMGLAAGGVYAYEHGAFDEPVIETAGEERFPPAVFDAAEETVLPVNINTADKKQLMTLPGIGEARAKAIIVYRKEHGLFEKPEDIMRVSGIKEGIFGGLKDRITVGKRPDTADPAEEEVPPGGA